jgi:hypothetical protein
MDDDFLKELKSKNKEFSDDYVNIIKQYYQKLMNNPAELQNTLNQLKGGKDQVDAEGGITITPDEYCCIKTTDETGQKIFLNLCSSDKVDPPAEQHILEMNNQQGVRIPLSLSEKYEDFDVHGNICQVYDAIFNPGVLKKTEVEPMVLNFLVSILAGRIKERFKKNINSDKFVRLKNLKYKGKSVRSQRIRARKVKIDEIINNTNEKDEKKLNDNNDRHINNNIANEINKEVNEKGKTPNWNLLIIKTNNLTGKLFKEIDSIVRDNVLGNNGRINYNLMTNFDRENPDYEYYNGYNCNPGSGNGFLLCIQMDLLGKSSGIRINLCDENMTLYCGKLYSLEINLPYKINSKNAKSIFNIESKVLYIYMPFYIKDINDFMKMKEITANENKNKTIEDMKNAVNISEDYLYDVIK